MLAAAPHQWATRTTMDSLQKLYSKDIMRVQNETICYLQLLHNIHTHIYACLQTHEPVETGQWEAGWRVWSGPLTVGHVLSWQTDAWKEQTVPPAEKKKKEDTNSQKQSSWEASSWAQSGNKVLEVITIQMECSKPHTIFKAATIMSFSMWLWAKKRLKIMRHESGGCVLFSIAVTGHGPSSFLSQFEQTMCGSWVSNNNQKGQAQRCQLQNQQPSVHLRIHALMAVKTKTDLLRPQIQMC